MARPREALTLHALSWKSLGERKDNVAYLKEAVAAYKEALEASQGARFELSFKKNRRLLPDPDFR